MTFDLGHLREYMYLASGGVVPPLTVAKEWLAALQSIMILFASVYRFYCNEVRSTRDGRGGHSPPSFLTKLVGGGSFVASCAIFTIICFYLLEGLPGADARVAAGFPSHLTADIISLQVLVLAWCGYPLVSVLARLGHLGVPGDSYSASWSTFKDLAYASLDVTSKGGLAVFFILKSSWVDATTEDALVAAGKLALNITR